MTPSFRRPFRAHGTACLVALVLAAPAPAFADSVAQVATAKRISRQTVALIDPQGRPTPAVPSGSNTAIRVGDILTFTIQFTPVANGASRGMGGYITDYIPPNTEVVGARIVDRDGNTVRPHRGGFSCDGYGPRGSKWNTATLVNGSMSQLYADTGIFYSNDARTARYSNNPITALDEPFLTLKNGYQMPVNPSGAAQYDQLLATNAPYFAHNAWDLAQEVVYGPGNGNTPEHVGNAGIGYGSPVAGPDSWYQLENTIDPPGSAIIAANSKTLGNVGPWQRIRTMGSEIGRRGQGADPPQAPASMPQCQDSAPTRIGVPAVAGDGSLLGWDLSPDNPLPTGTNAVRFALGELVVGDEYFAEISLRVNALPLDPDFGDVNCAEVAGGDASSRALDGGTGGKDHLWRYFLPAPACVSLDLLFENNVDKVLTTDGGALTNSIEVKNLSTTTQTNVVVKDCYVSGDETLVPGGTTQGYTIDTAGTGCPSPSTQDAIVWTLGSLDPGEEHVFTVSFTGQGTTSNQAVYTSDALPGGFSATAFTTVGDAAIMRLSLDAAPTYVATLPGLVHYTANVSNVGTVAADTTEIRVTLPASWTYKAGTATIDDVAAGTEPTQTGDVLSFAAPPSPASIAAGADFTIEFDVDVPSGVTAGEYAADFTSLVTAGQLLEDSIFQVADVAVLTQRSDVPTVAATLLEGATQVTGTSTEAAGATVTVYLNGNPAATTSVGASGAFTVSVPTLFAGQEVTASVRATSELESDISAVTRVLGLSGVSVCSDGLDNDGDGDIDFPADVGCSSANDPDETDVPACSDGIDNDGDTKIDFPADEGCSSYVDLDEAGLPACSNGIDDEGDGLSDYPNDPGCSSADDVNEADSIVCADGLDNDGDGTVDFPADIGCTSSLDQTEENAIDVGAGGTGAGGSVGAGGSAGLGGGAGAGTAGSSSFGGLILVQGDTPIPDLGSASADGALSSSGSNGDDGCSCRLGEPSRGNSGVFGTLVGAALLLARRRRQP